MATGQGIALQADPKSRQKGEETAASVVMRQFGGVNTQSPREDIADHEFYWLEDLIPVGPGNLIPTLGPGAALVTLAETGAPTFTYPFQANGTDLVLAVWANSGNAWVGAPTAGATWTKIATAVFTSGKTAAAQWNNLGVLIVDPTAGYYDYNITTASTLTNLSGQLYGVAVSNKNGTQLETTTLPSLRVSDPTGTGGTIGASLSAVSITNVAGGSGYQVGDTVQFSGGTLTTSTAAPFAQQSQPTVLTITTVNGTGGITGFSITNPGYYQVVPAGPIATTTGGAGTGATFNANWYVANPFVITPGNNYTAPVVQAFIGAVWVNYSFTISTSGTLLGTAIAVYAGRVWVAISRTVQFTDAGSYNSFANSGSAFTINDSYLHSGITALFAANNYLYIFGDDSVDILSNVTVTNGIANFSRINASSSVGTTQPRSIFPFLRSLAFCNNSGFYVMAGATPEKVSDSLDGLINATNFAVTVWGAQVMVQNILCAAFLVSFTDTFTTATPTTRSIICLKFKDKWWFSSQLPTSGVNLASMFSLPVNGLATMFGWAGPSLYPLLSTTNINSWIFKTKLWDAQSPITDKQALLAGIGAVFKGLAGPGISITIDDEYGSVASTIGAVFPTVQWVNNAGAATTWQNNTNAVVSWELSPSGYYLFTGQANAGGGKYLGLSGTGSATNLSQIRLLALEMERRRRW